MYSQSSVPTVHTVPTVCTSKFGGNIKHGGGGDLFDLSIFDL